MARYADLLEEAFQQGGYRSEFRIERVGLAARAQALDRVPAWLRTLAHHAVVANRAKALRGRETDLFHVVDGSHGYVTRWLPRERVVVTAHDLIPWLQCTGRLGGPVPNLLARWVIRRSLAGLARAGHVVADSESTAADVALAARIDRGGVTVAPLAVGLPGSVAELAGQAPPWRERRTTPAAYMLHVGNNAFYKNRMGVLRVFALLRRDADVRLKMIGPDACPELKQAARDLGLEERVDFIDALSEAQLIDSYRGACLLLFPSLYEGFGWPPLEAMACGCPVVASASASLPEVVGDAGLAAPAEDERALADCCLRILSDPTLAEDLVARGVHRAREFSLSRMAKEVSAVYEQAVAAL